MAAGRKKAFDENIALQAAMDLFWQKGYAGASLSELTQRMGINKPSMYSTFGNKEQLFIKATRLYIENRANAHLKLLLEPNEPLKIRLKNYMVSVLSGQCESDLPKGCYITLCQSEAAGGDMPEQSCSLLSDAGKQMQTALTGIFTDDQEAQSLGLNDNARKNALCITTTLKGTAAMARTGEPLSELEYVVDNCLQGIGFNK